MNFTCLEDISWLKEIVEPDNHDYYWYDQQYMEDFFSSPSVETMIFCIFLWLNTLLLIITVPNMDKVCSWLEEQHESLKDMYKASAGVLAFFNLAALSVDLTIMTLFYQYLIYHAKSDFITYLTMKLLLVILIIIVDLLVTCRSTLKHNQKKFHGIMHALALCQIVWFVHRLATDVIISVITFIIAPAQTLGTLTLLLSTVACAILFVSSLLKKRHNCCSLSVLCTILTAICTSGLIATVIILFIGLVDNGLQSARMGGFILSLIPPTTIFVIGLCVNREIMFNFYRNVLASSSNTPSSTNMNDTRASGNINSQANETTPLIQGFVSIDMEGNEEEQ